MSGRIEAEVQDIANRISADIKGTAAHAMVVDYLKLLRREIQESVSSTPDDQLTNVKAQIQTVDRILREITRNVADRQKPKSGAYNV